MLKRVILGAEFRMDDLYERDAEWYENLKDYLLMTGFVGGWGANKERTRQARLYQGVWDKLIFGLFGNWKTPVAYPMV
jgi:hypothetical protein